MSERAYEVRCSLDDFQHVDIRFGPTVAKVRARAVFDIADAWPHISFKDVKVRYVGERKTPRELAQEQVDVFNALAPVGTWVLVRQIIGSEDLEGAFCARVQEPVAFVSRSGHALVKVPGDCYAIECVTAIRWEGEA